MQSSKTSLSRLLVSAIVVLLIFSLCSYAVMFAHVNADSDWLAGWEYRKSHVVQSAAGAGTDYTVRIKVDFTTPVLTNPYYELSPSWTTVSGNPTPMHFFQPVHKTGIVEVDELVDGTTRKYLAYDCNPNGDEIRLYYTDDLDGVWTPYSGNPILGPSSGHYRTPSVVYDGSTFHMYLDDIADYHVEHWTSTDGITFTYQETVPIITETIWMSPYIWFNPNDNEWYLYHKQHGTPRILWVRNAANIGDLASATDVKVMDDTDAAPGTVAAQCIMYRDGKYWMVTEGLVGSVYNVWAYSSSSPTSGFKICSNSPILTNGEACPIHMLSPDGSKAYLFVSRQSGSNWYEETREATEFVSPNDEVSCEGHCKSDFGDIRFTGSDGTTLLNYWMGEKVDGDHAVFWVKVADDLSSSDATVYLYYGKNDATTTSNGDSTFSLFDDFLGSSLDTSKWIVRQGDVSVASSELELSGTTGTRGLIDSLTSFSISRALHTRVRWGSSSIGTNHFCTMRNSGDWNYRAGDAYGGSNAFNYETTDAGVPTETKSISIDTPTNYHVYKIEWKSGQSTCYQDDNQKVQHTTNVPTADEVVAFYEGATSGGDAYVDWCFVTKWVDPEPSHGIWGTEEAAVRDIAVVEVKASRKVVFQGYNLNINITVENQGTFVETFDVTLCADSVVLTTFADVSVLAGTSVTLEFSWTTTGLAKGIYTINAMAETLPFEFDTLDNSLSDGWVNITKVGDIGGYVPPEFFMCDGKCEGKDLALFLQCLQGTAPPEAMYLGDLGSGVPPQFFLCDGKVDGKDLALFLLCFKGNGPPDP